jgi:hypothetical protein
MLALDKLRRPKRSTVASPLKLVLSTMERGVMQARTRRDVASFDRAVRQFRTDFGCLAARRVPLLCPGVRRGIRCLVDAAKAHTGW